MTISPEELIGEEWAAWYRISPVERWRESEKLWKFSAGDIEERNLWEHYQDAYEDAIRNTVTKEAPWYVVPADRKWWARTVVAAVIAEALESMELQYPIVGDADRRKLEEIKEKLEKSSL